MGRTGGLRRNVSVAQAMASETQYHFTSSWSLNLQTCQNLIGTMAFARASCGQCFTMSPRFTSRDQMRAEKSLRKSQKQVIWELDFRIIPWTMLAKGLYMVTVAERQNCGRHTTQSIDCLPKLWCNVSMKVTLSGFMDFIFLSCLRISPEEFQWPRLDFFSTHPSQVRRFSEQSGAVKISCAACSTQTRLGFTSLSMRATS